MLKRKTFFALLSVVLIVTAVFCNAALPDNISTYNNIADRPVKNVIFLIGDGMGLGQLAVAKLKAVGFAGKLHIERMPVVGLTYTHSADSIVTDSAAAGTALACGVKTNNRMLGMTPDKA